MGQNVYLYADNYSKTKDIKTTVIKAQSYSLNDLKWLLDVFKNRNLELHYPEIDNR